MLAKKNIAILAVCLLVLTALFFGFDPHKVPSFVLILPFLVIFVFLFIAAAAFLQRHGEGSSKRLKIAALCAGFPVLLLVLQSIGQLTLRDILAVGILFVLSYFYIIRVSATV